MSTFFLTTEQAAAARKWYVVDASEKPLGRLATQVAQVLRGKTNPAYAPHTDTGSFVIVVNAEKVKLTGKKLDQKIYRHHSGYVGGLKTTELSKLMETEPQEAIFRAVKGMLPKNPLGQAQYRKLKVYKGDVHPHQAQNPENLELS